MYPLRPPRTTKSRARSCFNYCFLSNSTSKQSHSRIELVFQKINRAQLGSILLPKPDEVELLESIADTLSLCDRRGGVWTQKLRSLADLFRTLLHQSMRAQIRLHDLHSSEKHQNRGREDTVITDRFGFLPCDWTFKFDGGEISPIREITRVRKRVEKLTNTDGFLYPPHSYHVTLNPRTQKRRRKVPGTDRPALLHPVAPSHQLDLSEPISQEELRRGAGGFLIHLLAYLFGIRLQFHDWWFDSRVPVKIFQTHNTYVRQATVEDFLSHSYKTWRNWGPSEKMLITNVLFMHSRAPSYEWDWERFTFEYMVLDGCWKLAESIHGIKGKYHSDRIKSSAKNLLSRMT